MLFPLIPLCGSQQFIAFDPRLSEKAPRQCYSPVATTISFSFQIAITPPI